MPLKDQIVERLLAADFNSAQAEAVADKLAELEQVATVTVVNNLPHVLLVGNKWTVEQTCNSLERSGCAHVWLPNTAVDRWLDLFVDADGNLDVVSWDILSLVLEGK